MYTLQLQFFFIYIFITFKKDTTEHICRTKKRLTNCVSKIMVSKGHGLQERDKLGVWD